MSLKPIQSRIAGEYGSWTHKGPLEKFGAGSHTAAVP